MRTTTQHEIFRGPIENPECFVYRGMDAATALREYKKENEHDLGQYYIVTSEVNICDCDNEVCDQDNDYCSTCNWPS